jgi:hypothetical protein
MVELSSRDYTRVLGIAKKKIKKCKAAGRILEISGKNNILGSLGGSGLRKVDRFGIYNLPFGDISPNVLAICRSPERLLFVSDQRGSGKGELSGRKQVKFNGSTE